MRKPELLAPAGSREALIAAVENGADAVYLGGKSFSARQHAANFSLEEMAEGIHFAHLRGVKVYITVNTLLDNSELKELPEYLCFLYEAGADAIIVQDLGVLKMARATVPGLAVHASTQMTVHNAEGVRFLEQQGVKRVVLAREMTGEEIRQITAAAKAEIEYFVHGALCICYSGQCLMSSMIGGRSGNRGRCAQPCRLPYTLVDRCGRPVTADDGSVGGYILSPKDFNTIEILPQLIEAGVTSLKIEGRMKRPEYVATVVRNYREALDMYLADKSRYRVTSGQLKELAQIFNRDFTTGYLPGGKPGLDLMSHRRPNNRGLRLGRVIRYSYETRAVTIKLDEDLNIGDGLEIWVSVGGRVGTIVTKMETDEGRQVTNASKGMEVTIPVPEAVKAGDRVFKTTDACLLAKAQATFTSPTPVRRIPLKMDVAVQSGKPMILQLTDQDGHTAKAETAFRAEKALKRPLTEESVAEQMRRLGNTVFSIRELNVSIDGEVMVPQSEMNAVRRAAVQQLEEIRLAPWKRPWDKAAAMAAGKSILSKSLKAQRFENSKTLLTATVDDEAGLKAAMENGADLVYYGGELFNGQELTDKEYFEAVAYCRKQGKQIVFMLPRISKPGDVAALRARLAKYEEMRPDGLTVANVGAVQMAREHTSLALYADYPLNIYNSLSLEFCREAGLHQVTLSPELTLTQVAALLKSAPVAVECLVHGHIELMLSEYCIVGSIAGGLNRKTPCKRICRRGHYGLKDRLGVIFPVETDQYCRMHLFNAKELAMLSHLPSLLEAGVSAMRIEGKRKSAKELGRLINIYRQVIDMGAKHPLLADAKALSEIEHADITRGHYFRGVL
ncbi:MAG TPA: DUF3656 domain-containing protein [Negativicutes bacterium]|nr:DUF3656 domain-containing protein [Negativicutes bacterium]